MATITYCKGLPTPASEMNSLGFTELEMFLSSFAPVFHKAACETVDHLLAESKFNKSSWNTYLQQKYSVLKRHANGVISFAKGLVDSARECRENHVKTLVGKLKSLEKWLKKTEKKLKNAAKFYAKKNWRNGKTGCCFPLSYSWKFKNTNWQHRRFQLHHKKRRCYKLSQQIEYLKTAPIRVKVPRHQVFIVGSLDETFGNQICQWDGNNLQFRTPTFLEPLFGKYVSSQIGNFERNINRLPSTGAKTWHFYRKNGKWCVAVQFTPLPVKSVTQDRNYGCIGIDMNPGSIGWAYCDSEGNLKAHGQIPLQIGLPSGKQDAQIVDACRELATLAATYTVPIVCEQLDFSTKKEQLRERGKKYARMLSSWAYSRFYELLGSICGNRGVELITVNPAYTSVIGLVKFARMYGLASDEAAAFAVARRGMRLSEKLPSAITAYLSVNDEKHVWHWWNKLNTLLAKSSISCRHDFYAISNWESQVNHLKGGS